MPERLKQAIETGQITQEQAEEMIGQMQQGQGQQSMLSQGQLPSRISDDFQPGWPPSPECNRCFLCRSNDWSWHRVRTTLPEPPPLSCVTTVPGVRYKPGPLRAGVSDKASIPHYPELHFPWRPCW